MKDTHKNYHYITMFIIMIFSGLLSTMNVYVDNVNDIRFSMNDLYMILLMTGWMFFFMGIFYKDTNILMIGIILVITNMICIRNQFLITEEQYKRGMIPHHSMAIFMSKKLLEKENNISKFLNNIIDTQKNEILFMKNKKL